MNKFTDGISGRQYTEGREYVNIADYLRNNSNHYPIPYFGKYMGNIFDLVYF